MLSLIIGNVILLIAVAVLLARRLTERAVRRQRNVLSRWPIRTVNVEEIDAVFRPGPFGPTRETEVSFIGRGPIYVQGGTSDFENWILSVLSKRAGCMFEFGTCTGKTTYHWARNSPSAAKVVTVTLGPTERSRYHGDGEDDPGDARAALLESEHVEFMYTGTDVESKVVQLFADSKELDISPWAGQCDLVFVDGSHAYSYVVSDSEKALALVKPGGLVLWHDYGGHRSSPGVYRALNELSRRVPLRHISHTNLVVFRAPAPAA